MVKFIFNIFVFRNRRSLFIYSYLFLFLLVYFFNVFKYKINKKFLTYPLNTRNKFCPSAVSKYNTFFVILSAAKRTSSIEMSENISTLNREKRSDRQFGTPPFGSLFGTSNPRKRKLTTEAAKFTTGNIKW